MLTINVSSFSYHHNGMPNGNGEDRGGFVFDCRCLPNPGRDPIYQKLTGQDAEVIARLTGEPKVTAFLNAVLHVITLAVSSYEQRGFERLNVAFGCTGGQHRSVYCAEWLRNELASAGYVVTLRHTAVKTWPVYHQACPET